MWTKRARLLFIGLSSLLVLVPIGCATKEPRLSQETRDQFGTVGIVMAQYAPDILFHMPAAGAMEGIGRGGIKGAKWGSLVGASPLGTGYGGICAAPPATIYCLALIGAGATIGSVPAAIYGALTAEDPQLVEETEVVLNQALDNLKIQETLREAILKESEKRTRNSWIILSEEGPKTRDEKPDYLLLEKEGVNTILEARVESLGLVEPPFSEAGLASDPPLAMFMTVQVRVIGTSNGEVLYEKPFQYKTGYRTYLEWAADHAKPFRDAVRTSFQSLGGEIIWHLFWRVHR